MKIKEGQLYRTKNGSLVKCIHIPDYLPEEYFCSIFVVIEGGHRRDTWLDGYGPCNTFSVGQYPAGKYYMQYASSNPEIREKCSGLDLSYEIDEVKPDTIQSASKKSSDFGGVLVLLIVFSIVALLVGGNWKIIKEKFDKLLKDKQEQEN